MATTIIPIDPNLFQLQTYQPAQVSLIPQFSLDTFLSNNSVIEFLVLDVNKNVLTSTYDFKEYTLPNDFQNTPGAITNIVLDPEKDLLDRGYNLGQYIAYYNFLIPKIGTSPSSLFVSEISTDRTELRLDSTELDLFAIIEQTSLFVQERDASSYFIDFYLGFGNNQYILANNIQLDDQDINNPTILVKLYEPLPFNFEVNNTLHVVTFLEEPLVYQVEFEDEPIEIVGSINMQGPNFNIPLKDQVNNSTLPLSFVDLITTTLTSSLNQLSSLLEEKEIDINVDYTNFSNFIHFSSAQTRLENFYYKISLIEQYSSSIAILDSTINSPNNVSSSKAVYESKINNLITNFDGYEYFLYYDNSPYAWPKTTTVQPYELAKIGSTQVNNWFGSINEGSPIYGGIILSASIYDNNNKDNLLFSIPEYLRDDPDNEPYELFVSMVGQHYDNIWIYYKDITNKYDADNRLYYGISNDIVADAIRDFGVKLYQNNFSNEDLYTAFIGLTPEGGLFPFPNITGSLPTPSGFEYVNTLISASNDYMPLDDVNKSLYKRIYHNLPYLLKSKGTLPGLRALITSYGIPDTILRINEYGGKDKVNTNDWDSWQNTFNYAFYTTGSNFITSSWQVNPDWNSPDNVPSTLQFRFKTNGLPTGSIPYSQSLWYNTSLTLDSSIVLEYTGSGYTSGSYSGSIIDPYYQYTTLKFLPDATNHPNTSASIYLPFFDGDWWSVMVTRTPLSGGTSSFALYAGNKIYEGGDNGTLLGFLSSSIVNEDDTAWRTNSSSFFTRGGIIGTQTYSSFSGSLQEIRYYSSVLNQDIFDDYVMNPYSIKGTNSEYLPYYDKNNSSPNELIYRLSLGGELYTGSNSITGSFSIHPKVTGSWIPTSSFVGNSGARFQKIPVFVPNTEYFFLDQPVVGIKNVVNDKIRLEDNVMPSGDTLSPFMALSQISNASQSYTPNINYLEVAFSPQNEINEDIIGQIGYFNIGEYIGDPRQRFDLKNTYPDLDRLRNSYFEKYTKNYDLTDFIRLIKFFDNSLFKMIQDFVPARTSLASGVVIKQHLLERNKYPQPQMYWEDLDISGTLKPQWNDYNPGTVEHFEGGAGGVMNPFNYINNISQSWNETISSPLGTVVILHNNQDEFYNGELSGSTMLITNGILNEAYPLDFQSFNYKQVHYYGTSSIEDSIFENNYLNNNTTPSDGEILFFHEPATIFGTPSYNLFSTQYLKIAKKDCNGIDNSVVLGNINKVLIYNPLVNAFAPYNLTILNEQSNYYFYQAIPPRPYVPSFFPNQVLNYYVSASVTSSYSLPPNIQNPPISVWHTESGDVLNYFNFGTLTFGDTPNTRISLTASIQTNGSIPATGEIRLIRVRGGKIAVAASQSYNANAIVTTNISTSLYPLKNDQYYLAATRGPYLTGFLSVVSAELVVTQSRPVSTSSCESVIFEPYITTPNFYNSDENTLLNNVINDRLSTKYQDVDYTTNIFTPTNFNLIISESAQKAAVQDSNYTTRRHIIPRYLGSKSTSQYLNKWTSGDEGTYGKTPTVESLKTMVAYCDWIGGWPSEKMNASGIHVLYLIKSDGTVIIPNASENSLADIKGTFESGEKLIISPKTVAAGSPQQYRNIIRGGTRIEPILYTQYGHSPASWNTTMSFTTDFVSSLPFVGSYVAKSSPSSSSPIITDGAFSGIDLNNNILIGAEANPWINNYYTVNQDIINEDVSLVIGAQIRAGIRQGAYGAQGHYVTLELVRDRAGVITILDTQTEYINLPDFNDQISGLSAGAIPISTIYPQFDLQYLLSPQGMLNGDKIYVRGRHQTSTYGISGSSSAPTVYILKNLSSISIGQTPVQTNTTVYSTGTNTLWGYPDTTKSYAITCSNSTLNQLYDNGFFMKNITGSGFNSITQEWSIKYGDEFRFEGNELNTFAVKKVYDVGETDSQRVSSTGSVEVQFSSTISTASINLDHFLIRRYIDDASLILMEGYKPVDSSGPYIIRPEYVVSELDKSVDEFILDLTQKGLIQ